MKITYSKKNNQQDGATCVVFDRNKKAVLLVKRRDIPVYVLPGGGVEPGEKPEQAAVRETLEESGYKVKVTRFVGRYSPVGSSRGNFVYEAKVIGGKPTLSNESQDVQFFPVTDLYLIKSPIQQRFVRDAIKNLKEPLDVKYERFTKMEILRTAIKHPHLAFRFLLTKIGIRLNS